MLVQVRVATAASDWIARGRSALGWLTIASVLAVAAVMLIPALLGYGRYVVTGGSMTGTFDRGSIVFDRAVPVDDLRIGDVITYRPPPDAHVRGILTHRIVEVIRGPRGGRVFRTKGDFNASPDPWRFTLRARTQARVEGHVPYVGYALAVLGRRDLRMLLIGVPALLFGLAAAVRLWRDPEGKPA